LKQGYKLFVKTAYPRLNSEYMIDNIPGLSELNNTLAGSKAVFYMAAKILGRIGIKGAIIIAGPLPFFEEINFVAIVFRFRKIYIVITLLGNKCVYAFNL
jgi:hypothetical protein